MLRIISSTLEKHSQFQSYPGQFQSEEEALTALPKYYVKASLNEQEVDGGDDIYNSQGEAARIAQSVAKEFFPSGEMDRVWVEDESGNTVWIINR